jgi:uncharacterized membrane protein YgdD (TMEM256/DUF423 family)
MHKGFLIIASVLGALAVTLGAFGAHKLKELVPPETVGTKPPFFFYPSTSTCPALLSLTIASRSSTSSSSATSTVMSPSR